MRETDHLKKTPLWWLFLLNFVTAGVWWAIWFLEQRDALNRLHSREKVGKNGILFSAVVLAVSAIWSIVTTYLMDLWVFDLDLDTLITVTVVGIITNVAALVATIILTLEALKVRRILRKHFKDYLGMDVHISLLWTLLFQIFYLQYKINRL